MAYTPITGAIPTKSDSFPRVRRAYLALGRIGWDGVKIKKTCLTGVAFLVSFYDNADQFPLVAKHFNETSMRDLDKGLIVVSAHARFRLPADVFPHHNGPDALLDAQINDATACLVQIGLVAEIPARRGLLERAGGIALSFAV